MDTCIICKQEYNVSSMIKCSKCVVRFCNECLLTLLSSDLKNPDKNQILCPHCTQDLSVDCGSGNLVHLHDIKPICDDNNSFQILRRTYPIIGEVEINTRSNIIVPNASVIPFPTFNLKFFENSINNGIMIWPEFKNFYPPDHIERSFNQYGLMINFLTGDQELLLSFILIEYFIDRRLDLKYYNQIRCQVIHELTCPIDGSLWTYRSSRGRRQNLLRCTECNGVTTSDYTKHCAKSLAHKKWVKANQGVVPVAVQDVHE